MPRGQQPILELHDITKAFGGVEALRGVDFALTAGEIHGLVGENGAGKSTLIKIVTGAHQPDRGTIAVAGQTVSHLTPATSHAVMAAALGQAA